MGPRARSALRWGVGTLVFGSALLLVDIAFFHLWHLRRPRTETPEWHLQMVLGTGLGALLFALVGVYLLRRWFPPKRR